MPAKNLAELIRYARDNPGKLTVAAANPPTIFTMAQLRTREKLDIASKDYPIRRGGDEGAAGWASAYHGGGPEQCD